MQAPHNQKRLVFWMAYLIFFAVLNETVFNVSTPKIAEQFGLSAASVSWVMTIFMVFFGIGSVIYGKLADIYSLRRLIEIGTYIYCLSSVVGFIAQDNYPLVVLARGVQAMGASAIPALTFVVIARHVPEAGRGRVFGFITSMVSVSIGIGPVIGGFVSSNLHWAMLFLMPLPTLLALPNLRRELPAESTKHGKVDLPGAILVAMVVGLLVLYLNFLHLGFLAGLVISSVILYVWLNRTAEPFIDPKLFRNIPFRNGILVGMALFSVVLGVFFLIPLMLTQIHGLTPQQIGLLLFPGAISAVYFGPFAGNLADRHGNVFVVWIGVGLLSGSMFAMALALSVSYWVVMGSMLATYIGFTMFQTAMINSVSQTLPMEESGIGMGIFNLVSIIAGALGTTTVGKIIDSQWLDYGLVALTSTAFGNTYSDILLVFALVVLFGGTVFWRTFRGVKTAGAVPAAIH